MLYKRMTKRRLAALAASGALVMSGAILSLGSQAAADGMPSISLSKSAGLLVAGDQITINGTGFSTAGSGIYVALADSAKFTPTNAAAFTGTKWVHVGGKSTASEDVLNVDGTFSVTLNIAAVFGSGANATDCSTDVCAIYTLAAHGSADRSQDTITPVDFFAPKLTLSADNALTSGQSVTVTGRGFKPGAGVYLAQTVANSGGIPSNYGNAAQVPAVLANGTFSSTVTVSAGYTPRNASEATDCLAVQCYLASFNDSHDLANRDQDVWIPISFTASTPTTSPTETSSPPSTTSPSATPSSTPTSTGPTGGIAVSVEPAVGLDVSLATVTVKGTGFATTGSGIYVGVAATSKYDPANSAAFGVTKWVHLNATPSAGQDLLTTDGSFETTLQFAATFGEDANATDCRIAQCAIYTLAAHGSSDRSQDSLTKISFAGFPNPGAGTPTTSTPSGADTVTASISASQVSPGGQLVVTASGFAPGEQVQATLHSDPVDLGISAASASGDYTLQVAIPAGFSAGLHHVSLLGLSSGNTAEIPFTVSAAVDTAASTVDTQTGGALANTGAQPSVSLIAGVGLVLAGMLMFVLSLIRRPLQPGRFR